MTHPKNELNLQAYLDGELAPGEAGAVAERLARDVQARALFEELKATRTLLAGNEMEFKLPESREFFWSKIRRQIEREQPMSEVAAPQTPAARWLRFLAPAGALAALAVILVFSMRNSDALLVLDESHEIETPLEETSSFSFRSEAAAMTVVWVDSHRE